MVRKPKTPRFLPVSDFERRIGNRLAYLRRDRGIKQSLLAEKLGTTRNQLSSIESGRVRLNAELGLKTCMLFDINPMWLITGHEEDGLFPQLEPEWAGWLDQHFRIARRETFAEAWCDIAWLFANTPELEELRKKVLPEFQKHQAQRKKLRDDYGSRNIPDVRPQWPALLKDVIARTKPKGMKARLASDLGVPAPRISEWVKGKGLPTAEVALKLRKLFDGGWPDKKRP
jgi:transcriptional regulator with XRE-family HTH domain